MRHRVLEKKTYPPKPDPGYVLTAAGHRPAGANAPSRLNCRCWR